MTLAIRQTVTVQPGGLIEIRSPQLAPGARAEVIVLVESPDEASARAARVARLAAFFKELQASPQAQALTEDDLDAEIAVYRAGQ